MDGGVKGGDLGRRLAGPSHVARYLAERVGGGVEAEADRAREGRREQQEVGHVLVVDGVELLAVHLQRIDRFQHGAPLDGVIGGVDVAGRGQEQEVLDVEQAGRLVGALQHLAEANELPALFAAHSVVEEAGHQVAGNADLAVIGHQVCDAALARMILREVVELVDALPDVDRNDLAHGAGVFARLEDALQDRVGVLQVEGQKLQHRALGGFLVALVEVLVVARGGDNRVPLGRRLVERQVEHQVIVDVDEAGDVVGAFEIARHPVDRVGDPAKHGGHPLPEPRCPSSRRPEMS